MPTTFANTIDGNPLYAARAVADAAGNDIQATYATKSEVTTDLSTKQDVISDLATIRSGAAAGSTAVQPGDLATVARTGDYTDLIHTPSIPTATSDLTNDSGFITLSDVPAQVNADWNSSSGASEILNKPTIPSGTQLVPAATTADADKVLTVDSQGVPGWAVIPEQPTGLFQATYGTSTYNEVRDAVAANKIVYCSVNGRMAFLAFVSSNFYEFQYYRSNSSSSGTDSVFVYQVTSSGWTTTERAVKAGNIRYPVTQVNVNGASAMTGTVANITIPAAPTVDQTFDATSANAQSGVAVAGALATKQDTISDLSAIRSGASVGSTAVQPGDLAAVATSGSYNDLSDKPSIPAAQVNSDWNASSGVAEILNKPTLATVATSGSYNDLSNKPDLSVYAESADLATVATTGAYSDLTGAPTIPTATSDLTNDSGFITSADLPTVDQTYDATSAHAQSGVAVAGALATKQDVISDLATIRSGAQAGSTAVQPGDLATVATTGAYSDLTGTPTIPTATSDLTNDSGFITLADVPAQVNADWNAASGAAEILNKPDLSVYAETADLATVATTGSYADLSNKPSIPTATSDLTNDSGFITLSDVPAQVNADWNSSSGASEILHKPDLSIYAQSSSLATVATTGDYDDLLDKPTIPTVEQSYSSSSTNAQSGTAVAQAISGVDAVPDVTSSDNGKVLVATYSGGAGSYAWASTPPANAIILNSSSTWSDFHTPYSAGRKDIYYKHTSPFAPLESRAELYLHLTAVSDVDGSSTNFTYALFEGAWHSASVDYTVRCQFRYSGNPLVHYNALTAEQSYSSSSTNAQSGVAVAQAISAVNQVPASTSADADKVLTVDAQGTPAWASAQAPISAGNGIDITNNVVSVDTSVVATQTDLAGKEDAFDVGTGLEMDTSGSTPTLQVEAPVDIVAGTGIAIDNPDGNTMRITNTGFPISETDAVLCGTFRGDPMYTKTYTFTGTVGTSETTISMTIDEKKGTNNVNRIWVDPSTSFIVYGSAGNNFLPLSWRLGSSRQGSVAVLGASTGSLSCRCVDTSSTPITLNITIRYTVSNS